MKYQLTAKRLSKVLSDIGMTAQELSVKSGVSKASISQYVNGSHKPSNISAGKIGDVLNINPMWLMGFDVLMDQVTINPHKKGVSIPVYGRVAAGIPIEMIEDIVDTEEITKEMAGTGNFFGLKITGDSMEPRITTNDIVIVRQQEYAETGDIVIATVNGSDATCKRLKKYNNGIALISTNPKYDPMIFSNEDIINRPVRIIGKVVELRAKF